MRMNFWSEEEPKAKKSEGPKAKRLEEPKAKEIGRAEGKEIGRVEATRSVIQSALTLNLPVEQIAQICSCGVDRVRQVQASLEKEAAVQS